MNVQATTVPLEAPRPRRQWFGLRSGVRRLSVALRASEPHVRTVWVVAFAPYAGGAVGDETDDVAAAARGRVLDGLRVEGVSLGPVSPPVEPADARTIEEGAALTDEIDAHLDLIEGGDIPAAREFWP